jgi:hypothetical protein
MHGIVRAFVLALVCVAGCQGTPVAQPVPKSDQPSAATNAPGKFGPQYVIFGDGHSEWMDSDGNLSPASRPSGTSALDKAEERARRFMEARHLDWGVCVFAIPTGDGISMSYVRPPTHTQNGKASTEPVKDSSLLLQSTAAHQLHISDDGRVTVINP